VGSKGTIEAQYTLGGVPNILIPSDMLSGSGLCGTQLKLIDGQGGKAAALNSTTHLSQIPSGLIIIFCLFLAMLSPELAIVS
jgi:alpha-amylase